MLMPVDHDVALESLPAAKAEHTEAVARERLMLAHLHATIREVAPALKQVEIVKATDYSREHIRKIVDNKPR